MVFEEESIKRLVLCLRTRRPRHDERKGRSQETHEDDKPGRRESCQEEKPRGETEGAAAREMLTALRSLWPGVIFFKFQMLLTWKNTGN